MDGIQKILAETKHLYSFDKIKEIVSDIFHTVTNLFKKTPKQIEKEAEQEFEKEQRALEKEFKDEEKQFQKSMNTDKQRATKEFDMLKKDVTTEGHKLRHEAIQDFTAVENRLFGKSK